MGIADIFHASFADLIILILCFFSWGWGGVPRQVGNMRSFLVACQKFGVPAGALFDVDDRWVYALRIIHADGSKKVLWNFRGEKLSKTKLAIT